MFLSFLPKDSPLRTSGRSPRAFLPSDLPLSSVHIGSTRRAIIEMSELPEHAMLRQFIHTFYDRPRCPSTRPWAVIDRPYSSAETVLEPSNYFVQSPKEMPISRADSMISL